MDLTCFFVPGEKGSGFSVGEIIQLWGHERSELEDFAAQVKSIPYQVLTAFGPRVSRTYYFN
jgi:alanine racemase